MIGRVRSAGGPLIWILIRAVLALVVAAPLGVAVSLLAAGPAAAAAPVSHYDTAAYVYDAPAMLSSQSAAASYARGAPSAPEVASSVSHVSSRGFGVAANTRGAASGTGRVFVGTSRGAVYDIPEGWAVRAANNKGIVYQRAGAEGNADMVRIMEPTLKHPDGYVRVYNSVGQPVEVFGRPGPPGDTHIPGSYSGPWPGWPQ